jgi:hypothetical protein
MRHSALAAISACFLLSCSAIASFDGLAGDGSDGGTSTDASVPTGSADGSSATDARVGTDANGNAETGGGTNDAGSSTDARPDGDAANTTDGTVYDAKVGFCANNPGHTFCDDFDEVPLATNWFVNVGNGSLALVKLAFISPPNGVVGFSPAPDAGVDTLNDVDHVLSAGAATSTLSAEAAFKVEGATNGCDFIAFSWDTGQTAYATCYVDLSFDVADNVIVESSCNGGTAPIYYQTTQLGAVRPNGSRFSLSADLANAKLTGATGTATASVPLPSGLVVKAQWTLGVGVLYNAQGGTCTVHVDDVFADTK